MTGEEIRARFVGRRVVAIEGIAEAHPYDGEHSVIDPEPGLDEIVIVLDDGTRLGVPEYLTVLQWGDVGWPTT